MSLCVLTIKVDTIQWHSWMFIFTVEGERDGMESRPLGFPFHSPPFSFGTLWSYQTINQRSHGSEWEWQVIRSVIHLLASPGRPWPPRGPSTTYLPFVSWHLNHAMYSLLIRSKGAAYYHAWIELFWFDWFSFQFFQLCFSWLFILSCNFITMYTTP